MNNNRVLQKKTADSFTKREGNTKDKLFFRAFFVPFCILSLFIYIVYNVFVAVLFASSRPEERNDRPSLSSSSPR